MCWPLCMEQVSYWPTHSIEDPTDRLVACEVTHICAAIISTFYCIVLLYGLIFRWVLIRFSDRGLVVQGRPELGLFNQLFWVGFGTGCCVGIGNFIIVPFVTGIFEDSIPGRKCMLYPTETNNIGKNRIMIRVAAHLILLAYAVMLRFKVSRYFSGVCPKGHMSAIGKYKRNMIGFDGNCRVIFVWFMFTLYVAVGETLPMIFTDISPQVHFWIYNGGGLAFIWFFNGLVLPLSMQTPWKFPTKENSSSFYVHQPELPSMYYCPTGRPPSAEESLTDQILHSTAIQPLHPEYCTPYPRWLRQILGISHPD